jgi:DNA-directed RNA polymerase subunit RPC12/RpoP
MGQRRIMVVCPKCGNHVQARKMLLLTNLNTINCQVCQSKLKIKNKGGSSAIGGVGGGIGGGVGGLLLIYWIKTGNNLYIGMFVTMFAAFFILSWWISFRYIKLDLANPEGMIRQG